MLDLTGYKLTFSDEFNARSISQTGAGTTWSDIRSNWRFDANSDIGFGHSSFVDPASGYDPFQVQGGALAITAVPDRTPSGYPGSWESGLITTQGKFSQTYGYFEMRADLADAKGGWDAFWLLPDKPAANPNKLPGWQELDVVEHYGANNKGVYSTIHTTDQTPNIPWQQNRQVYSETAQAGGYHTYGMDWQKDKISFYVDGQFVGSQATPSDMTGPMYLLANLATQDDADAAGVPITMKIDYIRAYSKDPGASAVTQGAVSAPDGHDPGLYGATSATPKPASSTTNSSVTAPNTAANNTHVADQTTPVSDHASSAANNITASSAVSTSNMDLQGNAAQVYRLYQAALDRTPDASGLAAHVNALNHGLSLHDDAAGFVNSPEFALRFGGNTSDQTFVTALYKNVLDRAPDAAGYASWMNLLANHTLDRASVLIGFSESPENHGKVDPAILSGIHLDYGLLG